MSCFNLCSFVNPHTLINYCDSVWRFHVFLSRMKTRRQQTAPVIKVCSWSLSLSSTKQQRLDYLFNFSSFCSSSSRSLSRRPVCVFMCAELQSSAETQPPKPEEETMVSYSFLASCFFSSLLFPTTVTLRSNQTNVINITHGCQRDWITLNLL